jgi:uncharacterized protein (TIGR03435 family)
MRMLCKRGQRFRSHSRVLLQLAAILAPGCAQDAGGKGNIKLAQSMTSWTSVHAQEISAQSIGLRELLSIAWRVSPSAIEGAPKWFDVDRFDVHIRAPKNSSDEDLKTLARSVISKTFTLEAHIETREQPAFALRLADGKASKLKAAKGRGASDCEPAELGVRPRVMVCRRITMPDLAEALPRVAPMYADLPVVDMTGTTGAFDIRLTWSSRFAARSPTSQTLFEALESQLGLTLERQDLSTSILVIESIERLLAAGN